jgi:hypothetical protein
MAYWALMLSFASLSLIAWFPPTTTSLQSWFHPVLPPSSCSWLKQWRMHEEAMGGFGSHGLVKNKRHITHICNFEFLNWISLIYIIFKFGPRDWCDVGNDMFAWYSWPLPSSVGTCPLSCIHYKPEATSRTSLSTNFCNAIRWACDYFNVKVIASSSQILQYMRQDFSFKLLGNPFSKISFNQDLLYIGIHQVIQTHALLILHLPT